MNKYLNLTRAVSAAWTALVTVLAVYVDPVKVVAAAGTISMIASTLANVLTDNTVADAICNGLAYNVTLKTTTTPAKVG